jgi:hypothetical protein
MQKKGRIWIAGACKNIGLQAGEHQVSANTSPPLSILSTNFTTISSLYDVE